MSNTYYFKHEAVDRAFQALETFNMFVLDHPLVRSTPMYRHQAEVISEKMNALYQGLSAGEGDNTLTDKSVISKTGSDWGVTSAGRPKTFQPNAFDRYIEKVGLAPGETVFIEGETSQGLFFKRIYMKYWRAKGVKLKAKTVSGGMWISCTV